MLYNKNGKIAISKMLKKINALLLTTVLLFSNFSGTIAKAGNDRSTPLHTTYHLFYPDIQDDKDAPNYANLSHSQKNYRQLNNNKISNSIFPKSLDKWGYDFDGKKVLNENLEDIYHEYSRIWIFKEYKTTTAEMMKKLTAEAKEKGLFGSKATGSLVNKFPALKSDDIVVKPFRVVEEENYHIDLIMVNRNTQQPIIDFQDIQCVFKSKTEGVNLPGGLKPVENKFRVVLNSDSKISLVMPDNVKNYNGRYEYMDYDTGTWMFEGWKLEFGNNENPLNNGDNTVKIDSKDAKIVGYWSLKAKNERTLTVVKEWNNYNEAAKKRYNAEVTLTLIDGNQNKVEVDGNPIVGIKGGHSKSFTVPNFDKNGNVINYSVKEEYTDKEISKNFDSSYDSSNFKWTNNLKAEWVKTYKAVYEFKSENGKELPKDIKDRLNGSEKTGLFKGDKVGTSGIIISDYEINDGEAQGKWTFKGWDNQEIIIDNKDVKFVGTWSFEEKQKVEVNHKFETDVKDRNFAAEVEGQYNFVPYQVYAGTTVKVNDKLNKSIEKGTQITVDGGYWEFIGWDKEKISDIRQNYTFIGKWKFVTDCTVEYEYVSDNSDIKLPDDIAKLAPASKKVMQGITVTVEDPTIRSYKDLETKDNNGNKLEGTWEFTGWNKKEISNIQQNDKFIGTWKFTEKAKGTVVYEFEDEDKLPNEVKTLKPTDDSKYYEGKIVTAKAPSQTEVKTANGAWIFNGFKPNEITIKGNAQNKFTGSWRFTNYTYNVEYYLDGRLAHSLKNQIIDKIGTVDRSSLIREGNKIPGIENYKLDSIMYGGYKQDGNITVSGDKTTITLYYRKNLQDLTIVKEWKNVDTKLQRIPDEIKVSVTGGDLKEDIILKKSENWKSNIRNVKIEDEQGIIKYQAKEVTKIAGFTAEKEVVDFKRGIAVIVNMPNETEVAGLTIEKKDADSGQPLSGATFVITNADGKAVGYSTVDSDGVADLLLTEGIYNLREVVAPKGYAIGREVYNIIAAKEGNNALEIKVTKTADSANAVPEAVGQFDQDQEVYLLPITNRKFSSNAVYKVDGQNPGKVLSNAEFELSKKMNLNNAKTSFNFLIDTSEIGKIEFDAVAKLYDETEQVGSDILLSQDNMLDTIDELEFDNYKAVFTFDGNEFTGEARFDLNTKTFILKLFPMTDNLDDEIDHNEPTPTSGKNSNDDVVADTSNDNIDTSFHQDIGNENVASGNDSTVDTSNESTNGTTHDTTSITMLHSNNEIVGVAVAEVSRAELIGGNGEINKDSYVLIKKITSGNDGKIDLGILEKGEYRLKEVKAPEGYKIVGNGITEFSVDENGNIIVDNSTLSAEAVPLKQINNGNGAYYIIENTLERSTPERPFDTTPTGPSFIDPVIPPLDNPTTTTVSNNDTEINDDETPLATIPDEDIVLSEEVVDEERADDNNDDEILDDAAPLSDIPKTSDIAANASAYFIGTATLAILVLFTIKRLNKKDN